MSTQDEVLEAAAALVAAFGSHDTAGYFASFAEDATFVFHTTAGMLHGRRAYEELWDRWEREDGFHVESCTSTEPFVQVLGDAVAVFTHRVATRLRTSDGVATYDERETIVFIRGSGGWVAVHEHLSPAAEEPG
jgi:ketosteroid isomerase-like protein